MITLEFGPVAVAFRGPESFIQACRRAFSRAERIAGSWTTIIDAEEVQLPVADPSEELGCRPFFFHDTTLVFVNSETIVLWDGHSRATIRSDVERPISVSLHGRSLADDRFERTFLYVLVSLALRAHGVFYVHAALVQPPDLPPLLLLGESGSGKSTTTLNLMRAGARWWSDDACLIWGAPDSRVMISGIARPFHLTSNTLDVLPQWRPFVRGTAANGKSIVDVSRGSLPADEPLDDWQTVALTRTPGESTALHALDQASTFLSLARACAWFGLHELGNFERQHAVVTAACARPAAELRAGPDILNDPALLVALLRSHFG